VNINLTPMKTCIIFLIGLVVGVLLSSFFGGNATPSKIVEEVKPLQVTDSAKVARSAGPENSLKVEGEAKATKAADEVNSLEVATSIRGISLDQTLADFLFKNDGFKEEKFVGANGKEDKDQVAYANERYTVFFYKQRVFAIYDYCENLLIDEYRKNSINGISCMSSMDNILVTYKDKVKVYCGYNNQRWLVAGEYNISFRLEKNKIIGVEVRKNIVNDKEWMDCKDYKIK
jgi:hypothetical protein